MRSPPPQRGEVKETGVMVHLVPDEKVDAGPVIETTTVPIYPRDTLEALTQRAQRRVSHAGAGVVAVD
ncbi:MAG: formyltransferase family protein [Caldilineaceae bacterium]